MCSPNINSVCNKPGEWVTTYRWVRCIDYISSSIIFGLDFKTVQGGIFFCLLFDCIPEQTIRRVKYADVCEWFSQINIMKIYFALFINLLSLSIFKPLYVHRFSNAHPFLTIFFSYVCFQTNWTWIKLFNFYYWGL